MKNRPINIIHLIGSLKRGGRERQLCVLVSHANSIPGFRHRVWCLNRETHDYVTEYGIGDHIRYFSSNQKLLRLKELSRMVRGERPDLIYSWGSNEYVYALFARLMVGGFELVNGSVRHGIRRPNLSQTLRMILLKMSTYVVANSKAGLKANGLRPSRKRFVLYNGIENKFAQRQREQVTAVEEELNLPENATVLISVANFVPYKDYGTTLRALAHLRMRRPDFNFIFIGIGTGPMRKQLDDSAARLGLKDRVRFMGPVDNVQDYLPIGDIFIHSSLGEGCSNAILEAMVAGLPIIASDTGGTGEIIHPSFGRTFPYGDVRTLSSLIEKTVFEGDLAERGRRAGRLALEKYGVENMVANFHRIVHEILSLPQIPTNHSDQVTPFVPLRCHIQP